MHTCRAVYKEHPFWKTKMIIVLFFLIHFDLFLQHENRGKGLVHSSIGNPTNHDWLLLELQLKLAVSGVRITMPP